MMVAVIVCIVMMRLANATTQAGILRATGRPCGVLA
jgi:hypothetical protein